MTKRLERALGAIRKWPAERQDEAAELLLALDGLRESYVGSEDELAAIDEALAQIERGEIATDAQVEEAFARFRM